MSYMRSELYQRNIPVTGMFLKVYWDLYKCSIKSVMAALKSANAWKELLENVDINALMGPLRCVNELTW